MKSGHEVARRGRERSERTDARAIEPRALKARSMESCFEIAHVTWTKQFEEREPVVLGHASEPMS